MKHVTAQKARDRVVIEALVRTWGPISRAEIRELTQLRWTSVSPLVRELLDEGKLLEAGPSSNPMGRKQTLLRFNEESGYVLSVLFDPDNVSAAVTNLYPSIKSKVVEPTRLDAGADGLIHQLFACAHEAVRRAGISPQKLLGIGVADPGLVNVREGTSVVSSMIDFWKGIPLQKLFEDEFGVSPVLESSTRAQAMAERVLGAGEGAEDMIYVEYGRGIGAGITTEGRGLHGHDWAAGEFGHIPIMENGPACACGSFGCLEAIAGLSAIEARCRKAIQEGGKSRALEMANGDPGKITGWTILQSAQLGDKACLAIVEELERYLGLGIATLVNLFNPSIIVLDHRLKMAGDGFLEQVTRVVKRQALGTSTTNLRFSYATLGSDAGLLGAGLTVLEKLFEIPALKPPRFLVERSLIETLARRRRARASGGNSDGVVANAIAVPPA